MSTKRLVESKLFEGDVINFNKYVGSKQIDEQVAFELKQAEKSLIMLRNRLLYAKDNIARIDEAFDGFAADAEAIARRVQGLRNTFNTTASEA